MKLTDLTIRRASVEAKVYTLCDGARPPKKQVKHFIDAHKGQYGVESMCHLLHMAPSTYYAH